MIKTFIVEEERVFKILVNIDVPDDIQWQTEDYDNAIDAAVRKMDRSQWHQAGTGRKWRGAGLEYSEG